MCIRDRGLDEYHAELLPADKVTRVEELLKQETGKLAFVGDGINDAPVSYTRLQPHH